MEQKEISFSYVAENGKPYDAEKLLRALQKYWRLSEHERFIFTSMYNQKKFEEKFYNAKGP